VPEPGEVLTETLLTPAEIVYSDLPPPAFSQDKTLQGEQLACTGYLWAALLWQCHESLTLAWSS